ncbi:uncharacterized protein A1O9_01798 [Exophiala aquamarina CBS 119918]|uniref:Uncharacterized protein n=1 Tax=Exophiala aquamarina CBS 119918 TaxID=1182545 RepID=A0A072Q7D7_9EURO|nr:uncharacterized protein A1O9_01798 [Exophiala aquamarina CBS 119918]KEF63820.1 hypothetical protein A1O9_01798 [Exophiala aquamarina CBS 119918]
MFPNMFGLHRRQNGQNLSDLPASIGNPTALPSSIGAPGVATDTAAAGPIVTAEAPTGLTTIVETVTLAITSPTPTTVTTERTRTVTDAFEYASLTSAEAASATTTSSSHSSSISTSTSTSTAAASSSSPSSSNLSTLIPAIVVPVVVVLAASLGLFWFFMRRRHRRELQNQPEFVMAGKGEKLSSRSSSARSAASSSWPVEKKSPEIAQKEFPSIAKSPPTMKAEFKSPSIGVTRAGTPGDSTSPVNQAPLGLGMSGTARGDSRPYQNFAGSSSAVRPATAGRGQPPGTSDREQNRNRSSSSPAQRGLPPSSRSGPSPTPRSGPSPTPRGPPAPSTINTTLHAVANPRPNGPPPPATSALRLRDPSPGMSHNTRAQAPSRLEAPGAYNGNSSISQYSPIVKDTPTTSTPVSSSNKRGPPPPLQTSNFASKSSKSGSPTGLTEENLRIARFANSSRLGYSAGEPSPSPKLPPPATRSQLIPRESAKESHERFFAGSGSDSRTTSQHRQESTKRASMVSDADEYEDIDAKSDVSSLNEFERFDFTDAAGSRTGSAAGHSLNYFAAQNSPASGRGSPFGNVVHERW